MPFMDVNNDKRILYYESLKNLEEFQIFFFEKHLDLQNIIQNEDSGFVHFFITTAFHFFQDIWSSIIRRLPFTNDILMDLDCLIIRDRNTAFSNMRKLGLFFNNIILQAELGAFMNEVDNLEREGNYIKRELS